MASSSALPAVKGAAGKVGSGGGRAFETSASAPNVQIEAIDPKAEAVERKSIRLKRQLRWRLVLLVA